MGSASRARAATLALDALPIYRTNLPFIPMDDVLQRYPQTRFEVCAQRIGHGNKRGLHDLLVGYAEHLGRLLLMEEMDRRPARSQAPRASREHKAPYPRQNRTPGPGLLNN